MDLASSGEVASFVAPLDQFQPGKSAYECVAFGCADLYYSGPPAGQPAGSAAQIISVAESWYARETGSNDASNTAGMSDRQEYDVLNHLGLKFEPLSGDLLAGTRAALARGLPVLICGAEVGFFDVDLGRVPYLWSPSGNHCIIASGLMGNNLLVRDYANSEFFGYRRVYNAARMNLVSATVVWPRWMEENMVPQNWHDNGQELTAPNNNTVRMGFRDKVMQGWQAENLPLAEEAADPALAGGTWQPFTFCDLRWNGHDGVTVHAKAAAAPEVAALQATLTEIAALATKAASPT